MRIKANGITVNYQGGHFAAASDPSVVYDASHGVWLIASLGLSSNNSVLVSSSRDGINWRVARHQWRRIQRISQLDRTQRVGQPARRSKRIFE